MEALFYIQYLLIIYLIKSYQDPPAPPPPELPPPKPPNPPPPPPYPPPPPRPPPPRIEPNNNPVATSLNPLPPILDPPPPRPLLKIKKMMIKIIKNPPLPLDFDLFAFATLYSPTAAFAILSVALLIP